MINNETFDTRKNCTNRRKGLEYLLSKAFVPISQLINTDRERVCVERDAYQQAQFFQPSTWCSAEDRRRCARTSKIYDLVIICWSTSGDPSLWSPIFSVSSIQCSLFVVERKREREKEADSEGGVSALVHVEGEKEGEKDRKRKCHRTLLIRFAPSGPVNRETDGSTAEICSRSPNAPRRFASRRLPLDFLVA